MSEMVQHHLQRLRLATSERVDHTQMSRWIQENTYLGGKPYSFKGHMFQKKILDDPSPHKVVRKCSQVGLSETGLRYAAALMGTMQRFTLLYVLPTASFAGTYGRTRFTPIVMSSPVLRALASESGLDNQDVKQFGDNYLWFRGATSDTAPISVAADGLVVDEKSFADQQILGDFQSRLTHSPYRWKFELSTPIYNGCPIDTSFQQSRRHWCAVRCCHCGHRFVPSYYEHVRIPGFSKHLDEIVKDNIHLTRFKEAYLACPHCERAVDLSDEYREWIVENNDEDWIATGFQVQPFDAPSIISLPYLIEASTSYASKAKFRQFNLGLPAEDAQSGLTEADIDAASIELPEPSFQRYVIGADQGMTCWIVVSGVEPSGNLVVVHYEHCALSEFERRLDELKAQYRVRVSCFDMQPNVYLSMQLSDKDPGAYPAMFSTRQGLDLFDVKVRDADPEAGVVAVRQVMINRNAALDRIMADLRSGAIKIARREKYDTLKAHLTDMRRGEITLRNGEWGSVWSKSTKGNDHLMFALLYSYVAARLQDMGGMALPRGMFQVNRIKVSNPV